MHLAYVPRLCRLPCSEIGKTKALKHPTPMHLVYLPERLYKIGVLIDRVQVVNVELVKLQISHRGPALSLQAISAQRTECFVRCGLAVDNKRVS